MHAEAYAYVARVAPRRPRGLVVDIGARNINGSVRPLFADDPYVGIDCRPGPGVDIVANGALVTLPAPAACVVCCEVLEHTAYARGICANAWQLLQVGGLFIVTAAGLERAPHSAADGGPLWPGEYYAGVAPDALASWLAAFVDVDIETDPGAGDIYAVAWKAVTGGDSSAAVR